MPNANEVRIRISADAERLKRDMSQARRVFDTGVNGMQSALGALGVGFGAVQTVRFFKGIIDGADEMRKLAQKTNMAVEQVAGWTHALDLAGVSQEALQKAAKTLGTQMLDASTGLAEAKRNFAALDIDIKKNDGSLKSVNDVLLEVADRYANATDKTAAAALMNKVLGRSALNLIPAFKDGRTALEAMIAEGQALNPITEESARQAEQFNDNLQRLSKTIKKEFIVAMNTALPAMSAISENLVRSTREGSTFWGVMNEGAKLYLATMGTLFPILEGVTQKGFNALAAKSGTILRPGEVAGKIGGLPAAGGKPFTPKITDATDAAAAAAKLAAEMKKLRADDIQGWIKHADAVFANADEENLALAEISAAYWANEERLRQADVAGWIASIDAQKTAYEDELRAIAEINASATDEMTEFWKAAAQSMQHSMSGLFFDVMQGNLSDLSSSFKRTIDRMVADVLAAKAATALFGPEFGKGGDIGGLIGKGIGWLSGSFGGGGLAGIDAMAMPALATGTPFVPRDMPAFLHRGEAVIPAAENKVRGMSVTNVFHVTGPTDTRSQAQIAAAAGLGVQRALARNT